MELNEKTVTALVARIVADLQGPVADVPIGVSNRHIHLTQEDVETLFGKGYELEKIKDLKQPGQYACRETLTIVGPSMRPIEGVRVLGPVRRRSQVEISRTDSFQLKVKPPVRESGDLDGSAPITIIGPRGTVTLPEGCIIANRHIHMGLSDAARYGVIDGDYVTVDALSGKRTRWYDVQVRVSDAFVLEMHVDTDDANAAGIGNGALVSIVKE
ncbi:MAG: phosphate propanoyltransferase [Clostridia bacterium]|nr:phosphate propanoyltransferase [Clostridia bacterium]